jgi:exodeoxyribonuclease VII large subunit
MTVVKQMEYQKLEKLKQWRDDLAKRVGKPSYYILTNKNLEDALNLSPENPQELEELIDWGPRKIEKYGSDVLAIINFKEEIQENESQELKNSANEEVILSVAQYINFINLTVQQFNEIKVTGEINDLSGTNRGLAFFDLKDSKDQDSTMQCVVFRNSFQYLEHLLEDGNEVIVYGLPSIYPKNGNFKFVVNKIEPVGKGLYRKALEKLRKKLLEKGYFSEDRKRALPRVIKKIGLITSSNGAAIHDFKRNLAEFGFEIYLKNVYVEGDQAERSIIGAIDFFNRQAENLDILVIIRGGGSWESLKTFNNEKVVEAIIGSKFPVVAGIGHENDETFAGLSADFNCSTPSIVATYLSQTREQVLEECLDLNSKLQTAEEKFLEYYENKIFNFLNNLSYGVEKIFNLFNFSERKLSNLLNEKIFQINNLIQKNDVLKKRLTVSVEDVLEKRQNAINFFKSKIDFLNPENILNKGYAIIFSKRGSVLDSIKKIKIGKKIKIRLKDGEKEVEIN